MRNSQKKEQRFRLRYYLWDEVDWRKSTNTIAEEVGAAPSTVSVRRKKHAPETLYATSDHAQRSKERLSEADWSLSNEEIVTATGYTYSGVAKARRRLAPKA